MCLKSPGVGRKKWLINKNVYISVAYACAHKLCKVSVFFVYDKIFSKDSLIIPWFWGILIFEVVFDDRDAEEAGFHVQGDLRAAAGAVIAAGGDVHGFFFAVVKP